MNESEFFPAATAGQTGNTLYIQREAIYTAVKKLLFFFPDFWGFSCALNGWFVRTGAKGRRFGKKIQMVFLRREKRWCFSPFAVEKRWEGKRLWRALLLLFHFQTQPQPQIIPRARVSAERRRFCVSKKKGDKWALRRKIPFCFSYFPPCSSYLSWGFWYIILTLENKSSLNSE